MTKIKSCGKRTAEQIKADNKIARQIAKKYPGPYVTRPMKRGDLL